MAEGRIEYKNSLFSFVECGQREAVRSAKQTEAGKDFGLFHGINPPTAPRPTCR